MAELWLPKSVYILMPFFCFSLASFAILLPPNIAKWGCILYLYGYTATILYKRWEYRKMK